MAATITIAARMAALEAKLDALLDAYVQAGAPTAKPSKAKAATYATKAVREAGGGFSCACGATGLRYAPHGPTGHKAASFHRAPDGSTHTVTD